MGIVGIVLSSLFWAKTCRVCGIRHKHIGGLRVIKLLIKYIDPFDKAFFPCSDMLNSDPVVKEEGGQAFNGVGLECRLCEPGQQVANNLVLKHNADFYRHLAEVHFAENILEEVLSDVPFTLKPFKCNQPGCDFQATSRSGLVPHVGVAHKFAVKYYYQVNDAEQQSGQTTLILGYKGHDL